MARVELYRQNPLTLDEAITVAGVLPIPRYSYTTPMDDPMHMPISVPDADLISIATLQAYLREHFSRVDRMSFGLVDRTILRLFPTGDLARDVHKKTGCLQGLLNAGVADWRLACEVHSVGRSTFDYARNVIVTLPPPQDNYVVLAGRRGIRAWRGNQFLAELEGIIQRHAEKQ